MGLNKPITVSGGLTAAEVQTTVQSIIDAQTTVITGKVDAQTNTLKTDIPSSISVGASISDINASLDERMKYVGGVIPRGLVQNTISKSTTTSFTDTVLEIAGKGYLIAASTVGNQVNCRSSMTIIIDNNKTIVVSDAPGSGSTSLSTNILEGASTVDLSESNITIPFGSNAVLNDFIHFEESLKVTLNLTAPTTSYSSSASVSYVLLNS